MRAQPSNVSKVAFLLPETHGSPLDDQDAPFFRRVDGVPLLPTWRYHRVLSRTTTAAAAFEQARAASPRAPARSSSSRSTVSSGRVVKRPTRLTSPSSPTPPDPVCAVDYMVGDDPFEIGRRSAPRCSRTPRLATPSLSSPAPRPTPSRTSAQQLHDVLRLPSTPVSASWSATSGRPLGPGQCPRPDGVHPRLDAEARSMRPDGEQLHRRGCHRLAPDRPPGRRSRSRASTRRCRPTSASCSVSSR